MLHPTLRSLAFLTRLPPSKSSFFGEHRLGDDIAAFPLAGLVAAAPSALILLLAGWTDLSPLAGTTLAIAAMVWVTGALHEDGLGDVADGLGGHRPAERALAIMKDSRVGSYGALALILSILCRIAFLSDVAAAAPAGVAILYLGIAAFSRGVMAWMWASLPSADPGGLADSAGQPSRRGACASLALGLALYVAAVLLGTPSWQVALLALAVPLILAAAVFLWFAAMLKRRLGGQTGDALGATQQLTEIALLLGLAAML
ncbi:adenosylcobinamide-GDP ribazoletransferase [Consotaella salsifontis]|uniref:Adenosylcobinamide-GDP ribazoletransferase n=1 Tax=Consotaella salsifontis TaxID=1365950 RepID=A0A1T4SJB3_9HYPH|nr:adenosylcobinamide-GDP ribazoletransferase [Consotaella salsifontis]SKA28276.1 cobalamin-5'-phosphate synthase [Consotaella salsifontis]